MKNIQKLISDRKKLIDEMRSITTIAETHTDKKMTDAEGLRWGELNIEVDRLKEEIEREQRLQKLEAENSEPNTESDIKKSATGTERRSTPIAEDIMAIKEKRVITGMSELVMHDGGYLVQTDNVTEIFATMWANSNVISKCKKYTISSNSDSCRIPAIQETTRTRGHHFGGIQVYFVEEGGLKTYSAPEFRKIELKLKKMASVCPLTDELLQDVAMLQSYVMQMFPQEAAWVMDDQIFNGAGGGQWVGIAGHPALVTVPHEVGQLANTFTYQNVVDMYCRMVPSSMGNAEWYMNQTVLPQLYTMALAVGLGGIPVYMPAGMASAAPFGTLYGKKVNIIEQASALSTVGDVYFCDFTQYATAEKGGMQTASSIHVRFLNDETVLRFVWRMDGQPLWSNSVTAADGSGTTYSPFITLEARP